MIYIGNVKMTPVCSRRAPWRFLSYEDAMTFARISVRSVWARVEGYEQFVYRFYPGGRVECYDPKSSEKKRESSGNEAEMKSDKPQGQEPEKKWKCGDRVCFAHYLSNFYTVDNVYRGEEPNIELDGMSGRFHSDLFVEAPAPRVKG